MRNMRARNFLIITQKVDQDDPVLGFFCGWLAEFAKHCRRLTVISLSTGQYRLPDNVVILGLGKERGGGKLVYWARFLRYIWQNRARYDSIFVHMNPEYVVLAGWWWRLTGKKIILWYVHRQHNLKLYLAALFAHHILTVNKTSINLRSKKVSYSGHGIDTRFFHPRPAKSSRDGLSIVSVGRVSRIKNLDTLILSARILRERLGEKGFRITLIGPAATAEDRAYLLYLHGLISQYRLEEIVRFAGPVPYRRMPHCYQQSDLAVNLAPTGGLDKAVLEAFACGLPALVANSSFLPYLGPYGKDLIFTYRDEEDLAGKIVRISQWPVEVWEQLAADLRQEAVNHHDLKKLAERIITYL